ncbi:MAG TPA: hypothetical protein VK921_12770 [Anditalea sp.]|nr:hypothetical protein [Anditalea sp.]
MAEINVEKKSSFPWWIWIVIGLIVVGILFFLLGGDNTDDNTRDTDRDRDRQDTVRRQQPTSDLIPISDELYIEAVKAGHPNMEKLPLIPIA